MIWKLTQNVDWAQHDENAKISFDWQILDCVSIGDKRV